jgi:hypothetical protein
MTTQPPATGGSGSGYGGPQNRAFDDRGGHREQAMNNIRESSQQDRRVYVGNLSYDVKWHHLKDFMRQGKQSLPEIPRRFPLLTASSSWRGALCRCFASSQWNVEGGRL